MAQMGKIEAKAEIKSDPAKLYNFWKNNKCQLINMFPQIFKSAQVIEGEEGQVGSVMIFEYVLGKTMTVKFITDEINNEERSITLRVLEGEIKQLYSSFVVKVTVTDDSVLWCFEFEKNSDSAPNPDSYAELAVKVTQGMDLYFLSH